MPKYAQLPKKKKQTIKGVYMLVMFPHTYMANREESHRLEKLAKPIIDQCKAKGTNYRKNRQYLKISKQRAAISKATSGPISKGVFPSKRATELFVRENGHYMHEGFYYTHALIEFRPFGYERFYQEEDQWYSLQEDGTYKKIPKPECFQGIMAFSM